MLSVAKLADEDIYTEEKIAKKKKKIKSKLKYYLHKDRLEKGMIVGSEDSNYEPLDKLFMLKQSFDFWFWRLVMHNQKELSKIIKKERKQQIKEGLKEIKKAKKKEFKIKNIRSGVY